MWSGYPWLSCLVLPARFVGLPPLVGFLATGFLLNSQGIIVGNTLDKLADIGITLLLVYCGLKTESANTD